MAIPELAMTGGEMDVCFRDGHVALVTPTAKLVFF